MRPFTTHELQLLLAPRPGPCISLFLPTHRRYPETAQDPIRFKNLVSTTKSLLRKQYAPKEVQELLAPVEALPQDDFWRQQTDGLAVFSSPDLTTYYQVPMPLPEMAVIADTFHVKPLLGFLQSNRHFFVLALSQNSVAFYEGAPYALGIVDMPKLPASLAAALGIGRRESILNLHSIAAGGGAAVFHGQGMPDAENKKDDLKRFFRAIDNALWELLREEHAPLVLVGVGYYHPLYRSVSRYPSVAEQGAEGNFDSATPEEIHAKVWPIVSKLFRKREEEVAHEYVSRASQGQGTDDLHAIAQAAVDGRVRQLLVAESAHLWGVLDRASGAIVRHSSQRDTHDDDLLDDLAECVLTRGGEVLLMPAARMPTASPVAALLRW